MFIPIKVTSKRKSYKSFTSGDKTLDRTNVPRIVEINKWINLVIIFCFIALIFVTVDLLILGKNTMTQLMGTYPIQCLCSSIPIIV